MSVGMVGYLGIGVESAASGAGTNAWSASIIEYIPFVSETMACNRGDLPDPGIYANFYQRKVYNGLQRVEGGVQTVVHPVLTGYLLRSAFDVCTVVGSSSLVTSHANVREHRFVALGNVQFQSGSGSDLPTLTLEVNRGPSMGVGSSFVYYNNAANVCELVAEAGQFVRANFEFIGRDYGGKPRSTPSYIPAETYLWSQVSVAVAGTAKPFYESLTARIEHNLEAVPTLDGRLRPDLVKRNDWGRVIVNGTISFRNFEDYDLYLNGSEQLLKMTFTGKQISTSPANNEIMEIEIPQFRYSTYGLNIQGPQRITTNFTGQGVMSQTSAYAMRVSLVNTKTQSYVFNVTS